jgi:hypothetical protein
MGKKPKSLRCFNADLIPSYKNNLWILERMAREKVRERFLRAIKGAPKRFGICSSLANLAL